MALYIWCQDGAQTGNKNRQTSTDRTPLIEKKKGVSSVTGVRLPIEHVHLCNVP